MGHHRRRGTDIKLKAARQRLIVFSGAVRHVASPFFCCDHLCPVRIVVRFPFARPVPAVKAFARSAFSEQVKLGLDPMALASDPVHQLAGFAPHFLARVADSMPLVPCRRAVTLFEQFVHQLFRPAVRGRSRLERDRDVIGKPAGVDRDVGDKVAM
jgi:hypothetical protein